MIFAFESWYNAMEIGSFRRKLVQCTIKIGSFRSRPQQPLSKTDKKNYRQVMIGRWGAIMSFYLISPLLLLPLLLLSLSVFLTSRLTVRSRYNVNGQSRFFSQRENSPLFSFLFSNVLLKSIHLSLFQFNSTLFHNFFFHFFHFLALYLYAHMCCYMRW